MKKGCFLLSVLFLFMFSTAGYAQFGNPFSVKGTLDESSNPPVVSITVSIPENHYLYVKDFKVTDAAGASQSPVELPEIRYLTDSVSGEKKAVYATSFEVKYLWEPSGSGGSAVKIHYMGCNDETCFMPQNIEIPVAGTESLSAVNESADVVAKEEVEDSWKKTLAGFETVDTAVGYLAPEPFMEFLTQAQTDEAAESVSGFKLFLRDPKAFVRREGLVLTVIFILLGGLALNLTPCVLPMIPINLAVIGAGAQASSRKRGFALGAVYGAGIALVYGLVGVIVVKTGSSFGAIQSNPWFNLVIALIFIVLALAMFDLIHIDFSRFQSVLGGGVQKPGSFLVALSMGSVAALLAGACVAPVVIAVLMLAGSLGSAGLMLPFVLGLGMALPWPFAGAGLSFLPKPGKWMVYVKYGFGVGILLFVFYYGNISIQGFRPSSDAAAGGLDGHIVIDGSTNEGLAEAFANAYAEGKPVFIDFWASWCKNCKAMDRTFKDVVVQDELEKYVFIKYIAENPSEPKTKEVMDHFAVQGLPTFLLLAPKK